MSGSASDWLNAQNTGNVLSSIAHPQTINLLGMYGDTMRTANAIWANREAQAHQAQGEAAIGAIDPSTGQMDQTKYGAAMHAAGPAAALGAQDSMQKAQTLSTNQLGFNDDQQISIARGIGSLITQGPEYQTPAAYQSQLQYLRTTGRIDDNHLAAAKANLAALGPNPSPQEMRMFGTRMLVGGLAGPDIANLSLPRGGTQTGPGGRTIGYTAQPPLLGGGVSTTGQPGAPQGMEQSDINTIVQVPYPKFLPDGKTPDPRFGSTYPMRKGDMVPQLTTTGTGGASSLPPSLRNPANAANAPGGPGVGGGGVGAKGPATAAPAAPANAPYAPANPGASGSGVGAALQTLPPPAAATPPAPASPPLPVPPVPPAVVPPGPSVNAPRDTMMPQPRASLQGGVPVASTNALAPNVGQPAPANPLVAGDVNAIMAGRAQARGAPIAGTQTAQAPFFGSTPSAADIDQQKKSVDRFQDISDQAVPSRGRSAVLGNMLGDTKAFTTGPLASRIEAVRAWGNRFGLPVSTEGLSAAESFNKLAAQLANAQGATTDARLGVNQAANPHAELSPAGVDLMLRQLQGNEDYIQARAKLASSYPNQDARRFENEIGSRVDPRAFQFARMTQEQRQTYYNGLSDQDKAAVKSSYNWLQPQGLVGD